MTPDVTIVNAALIRLGEAPLTAPDENSKPARLSAAIFADLRDAVIRAHPWNCAVARAVLPAGGAAPAWGYARAFPLPAGPEHCLRVLSVAGEAGAPWHVEGRTIVTDLPAPLRIVYLRRIVDLSGADALLREALAARLARELAEPLGKSAALVRAMAELYEDKLREARSADGQEGTPGAIEADGWLSARA